MATKLLSIKMDESEIKEIKEVAGVYNMTVTDLVKHAVFDYVIELKKDPFYRLTMNVEQASDLESREILEEIESLSDDDLKIVSSKRFSV